MAFFAVSKNLKIDGQLLTYIHNNYLVKFLP